MKIRTGLRYEYIDPNGSFSTQSYKSKREATKKEAEEISRVGAEYKEYWETYPWIKKWVLNIRIEF